MLSNAYFLEKLRFDTAENEPAKFFQNFANFAKSVFEGDLPASRARSLVDTESETRSASDGGFTSRDGSPQPPPLGGLRGFAIFSVIMKKEKTQDSTDAFLGVCVCAGCWQSRLLAA